MSHLSALGTTGKRSRQACDDAEACTLDNSVCTERPCSPPHSIATSTGPVPDSLPWGCHATVGKREYQEDRHAAGQLLKWSPSASRYFSIFDGHGGAAVADFLAASLEAYIEKALLRRASGCSTRSGTSVAAALREAFIALDRDIPTRANKEVGGSTAVCVVLNDRQLVCANCGDSRAVLSRTDGILALSEDHKPDRCDEQARICRAGGRIINNGGARVMGMLSMTRAIGDTALQRFGVSPEPEVMIVDRSPADEFMIVASDGLWGSMSNEEAVSIVRRCMQRALDKNIDKVAATRIAAKVLVHAAMRLGSRDNITVMVVDVSTRIQQRDSAPSSPDAFPPVLLDCSDRSSAPEPGAAPQPCCTQQPLMPTPQQLPQQSVDEQCCASGGGELLSAEDLLVHLPTQRDRSLSLPDRLWCSCQAVPNCCNGASSCLVEVPRSLQTPCCPSNLVA